MEKGIFFLEQFGCMSDHIFYCRPKLTIFQHYGFINAYKKYLDAFLSKKMRL